LRVISPLSDSLHAFLSLIFLLALLLSEGHESFLSSNRLFFIQKASIRFFLKTASKIVFFEKASTLIFFGQPQVLLLSDRLKSSLLSESFASYLLSENLRAYRTDSAVNKNYGSFFF
jgi:hypothetical protein